LVKNFNKFFIENIVLTNAEKRQFNEVVKQYRLDENYITDFKILSELTLDITQESVYKEVSTDNSEEKEQRRKDDFNIKIIHK